MPPLFKNIIRTLWPVICFVQLMFTGCSSGSIPCQGIPASSCQELIAMHEIFPGELVKSNTPLQLENYGDNKGIWIGADTFRVIINQYNIKMKTGSKKISCRKCDELNNADIEHAENSVLYIFKEIHVNELYRKQGMINYELSLTAFEKEVKSLIRNGSVLKYKQSSGCCRAAFQVNVKCLKKLIYAGNRPCE